METTLEIMEQKFIGVTMLFAKKEDKSYKVVKSSYIIEKLEFKAFKDNIQSKILELIKTDFAGYKYLGIDDFYISEDEGEGNFLGRTSYYDDKTLNSSKKHILTDLQLERAIEESKTDKKINVSFVYFHEDEEGPEYNSTIIVHSQLTKSKTLKSIIEIANSESFKEKICNFSVEELYINRLNFIGISELYGVKKSGLFSLYNNFDDINLKDFELVEESNFKDKLDEIEEDYQYIN